MQKDTLWIAGLLALIIFISGIMLSSWFGNSRVDVLKEQLDEIETNWNDARLQGMFLEELGGEENCDAYLESNLDFNYRIYQQGLSIGELEKRNRFSESTIFEKKRYALLQLQFWLNSIRLKEICNFDYSNLVYMYSHFDKEEEQRVQSDVLASLKNKCGDSMMLIPLPGDLDITTINLVRDIYQIREFPSILINEKVVLTGLQSEDTIRQHIKC